jgi:hypothetical protein
VARGWESKSVEEQQAEATMASVASGPRLTPEQAAKLRNREGLLLSRKRVLQQLQTSRNPAHHEMLEKALVELDDRLAKLDQML